MTEEKELTLYHFYTEEELVELRELMREQNAYVRALLEKEGASTNPRVAAARAIAAKRTRTPPNDD